MKLNEKSISDFCDEDYLGFANYVVEHRAIPSVIDGLKPTHRKIVYIANKIWRTGNEKPLKVFQLGGKVSAEAYYHHGDGSLNNAIIGMAQTFKNSMPLLQGIGQFGSLRSPEAGAPRYIAVKLHPNFRLLYKDFELLKPRIEEGVQIEPEYFLPIIPTVLLNGSQGIAVGFATKLLNRNPLTLIDECLHALDDKPIKMLKPWVKGYIGEIEKDTETPNKWVIRGKHSILNTSTIQVSELPPNITYSDYEKHLNNLVNKREISSYEDNSSEKINYTLKFRRANLEKLLKTNRLDVKLKMRTTETENLTTLDEHGKLKIFKSVKDIVKYFVDFRLTFYQKRKDYFITKLEHEVLVLNNRARFIKGIIDGVIKVNKVPKLKIIEQLTKLKFDLIDDSYDYLLSMPIHSLTKEKYTDLMDKLNIKKKELAETKKLIPKDMYKKDLLELKAVVKKDVK